MHSRVIVQWNSTRRDHPGNPGGVSGSGPVIAEQCGEHLSLRWLMSPKLISFFNPFF